MELLARAKTKQPPDSLSPCSNNRGYNEATQRRYHHPHHNPPLTTTTNQRSLARSLGNGKRTSIRESAFSLLLYCSHVHPEQLLQRPFQFNPPGPNPRHLLLPLLLLLLRRAYSPPRSRSGGTVGAQKRTKRQLPLLLLRVLLPRDNTTATEYPFHPTPQLHGQTLPSHIQEETNGLLPWKKVNAIWFVLLIQPAVRPYTARLPLSFLPPSLPRAQFSVQFHQ